MKKATLFLLALVIMSCSSSTAEIEDPDQVDEHTEEEEGPDEEEDPEEKSLIPDLLVLGRYLEQSGFLSDEIFQWEHLNTEQSSSPSDLFLELGITNINGIKYYTSESGLVVFNREPNPDTGIICYYPYFKNFNTTSAEKFDAFMSGIGLSDAWIHNENIVGIFRDDSTNNIADSTYEYLLKSLNTEDRSEQIINLGRFRIGETLWTSKTNNILYIYHRPNLSGDPEATLFVVDLNDFVVLETLTEVPEAQFKLISDQEGNCYFFASDLILKFDLQSRSLEEIQVPGNSAVLASRYAGRELQEIIVDNKCFFALIGPQPGPPFAPAIYDLVSGEVTIIDLSQEITQFEGDEFPWNPLISAVLVDTTNNKFLIGVRSAGFAAEISSYAIFAVDFEGNVLEKKQIPLVAIALYQ